MMMMMMTTARVVTIGGVATTVGTVAGDILAVAGDILAVAGDILPGGTVGETTKPACADLRPRLPTTRCVLGALFFGILPWRGTTATPRRDGSPSQVRKRVSHAA